jgi:UDP-N-acetylglucosamine/UDP-N-acetyl-alpha-D-glucosaminouronate 4-epimerase
MAGMAKYLITGAAGFIGSALAHALVEKGESVRGIDNFATGKRENLAAIAGRMEFIEADLLDGDAMARACQGIDYVLHQAAIPSVPRSVADPLTTDRVNVEGTLKLLLAARDAKVKRVVYAGSSSAYGDTPTLPKHEAMPPNPISPYAVAKLTGEWYMQVFQRVYGLETVVLRYFNVFGPRQDAASQYSGVLARFITCMLNDEEPIVFGDGEQSRDFTYVDNVVAANLLACEAAASAVSGQVFNIAAGRRTTLNQTVRSLKRITLYEGQVAHGPERAGDIKHSLADISRAVKHLGYKPTVGFEEGLERTVAWYRKTMPEHAAGSAF